MHIADIHQQVREEDSVHHLVHIIRVRPDQHNTVFGAVCDWVEGMRNPWLNLMRPILWGRHALRNRVSLKRSYFTLKDLKSLRLVEVQVQRWSLSIFPRLVSSDISWNAFGIST